MNEKVSYERYNRQIILNGFGEAGQKKLAAAKALVIGAGGLGCPALQYLAAAGVGTIGIVDDDTVSLSNLQRQVLYATEDVGSGKVDCAIAQLRSLNPEVVFIPYRVRLDATWANEIVPFYDVVIDGTDNFATRYLINDACKLFQKPMLYGAVSRYEGQVGVFHVADKSGYAANYRDLFPQPPKGGEVPNCAEAGVLGVLPGIIGTMQAAEAIKLIAGIGEPLRNKLLTYNVLTAQFYEIAITPSETSNSFPKTREEFLATNYGGICGSKRGASVVEIDAEAFNALREKDTTIVIDVREWGERPLLQKVVHRQIPMSVFKESMPTINEKTVVLLCQHGVRSLRAAEMMQAAFGDAKELYSLKGGLVRWGDALQSANGQPRAAERH
jgi:molybdopterin/thiamine biosynthesis adenylyltransferase/rhodanese-related sulfurtransferase